MTRTISNLSQIEQITRLECRVLKAIEKKYAFSISDYYLSLINWANSDDPIRKICIPSLHENDFWGSLTVSDEKFHTAVPGLEHKYKDSATFLINNTCAGYCRFCHRKRLLSKSGNKMNIEIGLDYIRDNPEITNIILSGGDPLMLATPELKEIIKQILTNKHIQLVQIETKIPAFNPFRILFDPSLTEMLGNFNNTTQRVYMITHFNHPDELTKEALQSLTLIKDAGAVIINQTPILRGINDDSTTLRTLFNKLSSYVINPQKVLILQTVKGNKHFQVPIEESFQILRQAQGLDPKSDKKALLLLSHTSGELEITDLSDEKISLKYIKPVLLDNQDRELKFIRNPQAYHLNDYFPNLPG